jgi:hypothetical protein
MISSSIEKPSVVLHEEGMTLGGSRSFAEKAASRLRGATVSGRDRLARASALLLMQDETYNDWG